MILIVEGSNKVGKTTFINKLTKILEDNEIRVECQNRRPARNNQKEITKEQMADYTINDFINALRKSLKNTGCKYVYIFDRSYISEYIYGKHFRNYENDEVMKLDQFITELPFVEQVFLISNYDHIEEEKQKLEYEKLQHDMMVQIMKCRSSFNVKFIENENDAENAAIAYAYKIRRQMQ